MTFATTGELQIHALMLQEAHLLREWSMRLSSDQRAAKLRALAEARHYLEYRT